MGIVRGLNPDPWLTKVTAIALQSEESVRGTISFPGFSPPNGYAIISKFVLPFWNHSSLLFNDCHSSTFNSIMVVLLACGFRIGAPFYVPHKAGRLQKWFEAPTGIPSFRPHNRGIFDFLLAPTTETVSSSECKCKQQIPKHRYSLLTLPATLC